MINSLTRQITIDLITDTPNPIIEWFNALWNTLNIIEANVYHKDGGELIYYNIVDGKKQWVFFQDNKNGLFGCNYDLYWSILQWKYKINYSVTQTVTKLLIENALNNNDVRVETPWSYDHVMSISVVNALNNHDIRVAKPELAQGSKVENALNNHITTSFNATRVEVTDIHNAKEENIQI